MNAVRAFLLLAVGVMLVAMVWGPSRYDSERSKLAHEHYYTAPNATTLRELNAAKKLDKRDILVFRSMVAAGMAVSLFLLVRAGKHEVKNPA